ncbi:hypothetical protein [Pyruvatibacter sp.]|uniref:hypothetical protein n=1 Tax=Pyruvatibacter sp. TaxID=1981328 RepID=UPI0032EFF700
MNMAQRLGAMTIALWAANAISATFTVGQGESIQAAIDASAPGDVIELTPRDRSSETSRSRR